MPDYPEIPYFKVIRILECIFCLALVLVFLLFAIIKNPDVFGRNLTAISYISYGGFLLILIIDIVSQLAGEPIAPVPMCLFCLSGFALHLTAGILTIYTWTEEKDNDMNNPLFCVVLGVLALVSAILFLIDAIIYLRNMLKRRRRIYPMKRPIMTNPFIMESLHESDGQERTRDGSTPDKKPIHVITEVKIIHVEPKPRCFCHKTVQTCECDILDETPINRRIAWHENQVPLSSRVTAEVQTEVVQTGPDLNIISFRDVSVQNEEVDRYPAKTRLASSNSVVEIYDKDIQTECPCVERGEPEPERQPKREPKPEKIDEGFQTYMQVRDVWAQNGIVRTSPVQSRRVTAMPDEVDVMHRGMQTESDRSVQFEENNTMMDVSTQDGVAVRFPTLLKPRVTDSDTEMFDVGTQTEDDDDDDEIEVQKPYTPHTNVGEMMDVSVQDGVAVQFPTHRKPHAVDSETATYDDGTQTESATDMPAEVPLMDEEEERTETPPTGCCGKKKKKKARNTRRSEYLKPTGSVDRDSVGQYDTEMPEDQVWPPERFPNSRRSDYVGHHDYGTQIGSVSSIDTPTKFTRRSDYTGLNRTEETQTSLEQIDEIKQPKDKIDSRRSSSKSVAKPAETQTSRSVLAESRTPRTSVLSGTAKPSEHAVTIKEPEKPVEEVERVSSEEDVSPISEYPIVEDEDVWPGARSQSGPLRHSKTEVVPSAPSQKECYCPPISEMHESVTGPKPVIVKEVQSKKSNSRPTSKTASGPNALPKTSSKQTKEPLRTKSRASGPRDSAPSSYGGTFHMSRDVAPLSSRSSEPYSTTTSPRHCIEDPPPQQPPPIPSLPPGAVLCFCPERDNCGPLVPLPPGSYPQMTPHHYTPSHSNSNEDPDTFYLSFPSNSSHRAHHSYPVSVQVTGFPKSPPMSPNHPPCCPNPEEEQEWVNVPGYYRPKRKQHMDVRERYRDWSPEWSDCPGNSLKNSPGNSPENSSRKIPESLEPSQRGSNASGSEQEEKKHIKYACELKPGCRDKIPKSRPVSRDNTMSPTKLDSEKFSEDNTRKTREDLKRPLSIMSDRSNLESHNQTPKRFATTVNESRSPVIFTQYIDHHERIEYTYPETSPTNRARIMERVDYLQPETHMRSRPQERVTEFERVEFSYGQPPCEVVCERVSHHEVVPHVATVVPVAPSSQAAMLVRVTPRNRMFEDETVDKPSEQRIDKANDQRFAGRM